MLDAAALAAILDPERTIEDWWDYSCPECGDYKGDHSVACFDRPDYTHAYYGPPDLHTAREHAWRMEEWLEARGIGWIRHVAPDMSPITCVMLAASSVHPDNVCNEDHTAALVAAVERISNEVR